MTKPAFKRFVNNKYIPWDVNQYGFKSNLSDINASVLIDQIKNYYKIAKIKKLVGQDKVLLGLSGGVDSSVVAKLLDMAIGQQLICIFVDTGLLRRNEANEVMKTFETSFSGIVKKVDAGEIFFRKL